MNLAKEKASSEVQKLFSNSVMSRDYKTALEYIKLYGTLTNIDVEIYVNILNKILGLDTFFMKKKNSLLGVRDIPNNLMINYNYAIDKVNEGDYNLALKHIFICEKLIYLNDLKIDLDMLEILLKRLCIKDHNIQREKEINELKKGLISEYNIGYCYYILFKLKDLVEDNDNVLILLIESCLQLYDYEQVEKLLCYFTDCKDELYDRVDYYRKEVAIQRVNNLNYLDYLNYENEIESLFILGKVEEAIKLCEKRVIENNNSIYLYKLSEVMFNYYYYTIAKEYFIRYLTTNNLYSKNVYYYLYFISLKQNETEEAEKYLAIIFKLSRYKDSSIDLNSFRDIIDSYQDNFNFKTLYNIEKDIFCESMPKKAKKYVYN